MLIPPRVTACAGTGPPNSVSVDAEFPSSPSRLINFSFPSLVTLEGKCKSGRIWTYIGDREHPHIVYDYTPDRTRAGPSKWLDQFKGYLQADAYGGYDGIYATGVKECACWAHGRRHFFDAKDTDARRAAQMLAMVRDLYKVEDEATAQIVGSTSVTHEQADAVRLSLRQAKSVPVLAMIKTWLDAEQKLVLPRSPMAQARPS